jgi:hypothetical protein
VIIQLDSPAAGNLDQARHTLQALADSWGHAITEIPGSPAPGAPATHGDGKAIDAVALTGLILSIPPAALAVLDLPDRIRKRRRAQELIDHAQQLATLQITIYLQLPTRTVELSALTPDQLLDLQDDERPDD